MCGRFSLDVDAQFVIKTFELKQNIVLTPRYNIAPGQVIPVLQSKGQLQFLNWGLKPSWLKEGQNPFINARLETVQEKPAFRQAFKTRRCLIIATGYYEWKQIGKTKQPYLFSLPNTKLFTMAGIYEADTCAIITTTATAQFASIHDRMPLIIAPEFYELWIDPKTHIDQLQICMQNSCNNFAVRPVSTKVNNPKNDSIECTLALQ